MKRITHLMVVLGFLMFMFSCASVPKLLPDGMVSPTDTISVALWNVDDYIDRILLAKGFEKPVDHEANFWRDWILGVGMSIGGVLFVGGLLIIVFSELTKVKMGTLCSMSGIMVLGSCWLLMRFWWVLCVLVGIAILGAIVFAVYYMLHDRDVLRRLIQTTETAKNLPQWETLESEKLDEAKSKLRQVQGHKQKYIKKLHDRFAK